MFRTVARNFFTNFFSTGALCFLYVIRLPNWPNWIFYHPGVWQIYFTMHDGKYTDKGQFPSDMGSVVCEIEYKYLVGIQIRKILLNFLR